jgi:hypothetical protein
VNQVVIKLKEIITKSNLIMDCYKTDINYESSNKHQTNDNMEEINMTIYDNNIEYGKFFQNFDKININDINEIEPKTQNIKNYIFEENLRIIVNELIEFYFKKVNEGKEERIRKQAIINYFDYYELSLQETYNCLLNNQNDSNFVFLFGYFNFHGIGTEVNVQKASELYQKAVVLENNAAQFDLANIYMDEIDIEDNHNKAFELSEKLAKNGHPGGMNLLGYCYDVGIGTNIDEEKAFELYQKAANLGNSGGLNNLGTCYEIGTGTDVDKQKAFELYQKAANLESSFGINNLASCYKNGTGTGVNEQKAFELYQKAANLENLSAVKNLAYCYKYGVGTSIDEQKANELYQKAANLEKL